MSFPTGLLQRVVRWPLAPEFSHPLLRRSVTELPLQTQLRTSGPQTEGGPQLLFCSAYRVFAF